MNSYGSARPVAVAAVALVAAGIASAPPASAAPGTAPPRVGGHPARAVTLITGDTVQISTVNGRHQVNVVPAPRPDGQRPNFWVSERGGDLTVLPSDVAALVPSRLDPKLFDVTRLIAQGDADARSGSIPLIVSYHGTPERLPGTTVTRSLTAVHGTAVRAHKATTHLLGAALATLAQPGRTRARAATPVGSVQKIWLDERVHVTADPDDEQIGAPPVWQQGFDGTGETVAVLDTGIDTSHPDLAGRVVASENFSDSPDAIDHFGHGTHVASIIAGTGAASDGAHTGVAYGATLLNGKVLDDGGYGYASSVIAGMEWASTDEHARIVNMSLGFQPGSYGTGPVTDAVDTLSAANNTLFVVAAGNGSCASCIGSPADAASALTVGAVDRNDDLADFTSRGPVPGNYRVKPDITAPGVDIVADRAAGTGLGTPIDQYYTTLSGTSMAAPHVAGAAALLLEAHPDLTWAQLKAELMDTAEPADGATVYDQGDGRLDVDRAVNDTLAASTGSLDYGFFSYPHAGRAPVAKTIDYRNRADHAVTVDLAADVRGPDGTPTPVGMMTVTPQQLSIPAGGDATATITLDTTKGGSGLFGGTVTATASDGSTVRTDVGFDKEGVMYDLTVKGIARDGRTAVGGFRVLDLEDGSVSAQRYWPGDPSAACDTSAFSRSNCVRVAPGRYSVLGFVFTNAPDTPSTAQGRTVLNTSLVGNPQLAVKHDMTITLDARSARPVHIDTPGHPDATADMGGAFEIGTYRAPQTGPAVSDQIVNYPGAQLDEQFFVQPTQQVSIGSFTAYTRWRLEAPALTFGVTGPHAPALHPTYYDPVWFSDVSSQYPRLDGRATMRVVDAGTASAAGLAGRNLSGALALVRRSDAIPVADQSNNAAAAGARMVAIYNDAPGDNADPGGTGVRLRVPTVRLSHEEGTALLAQVRKRTVRLTATGITNSPYLYDLLYRDQGGIPTDQHYVARRNSLATVARYVHGQPGSTMTYSDAAYAFQPGDAYSISTIFPRTGGPRVRQDYYLGDPDVRWAYGVQTPESPYNYLWPEDHAEVDLNTPGTTTYRAGEHVTDHWFGAPIAPGIDPLQPLQRVGDVMRVHMAGFVDSSGHFSDAYTSSFANGFDTEFQMYANGRQIAETKYLPSGLVDVPAGPGDYRIDYTVDNAAPWAALSTRTSSSWTWHSSTPADGDVVTEPLLVADWDVHTDLHGVAGPGRLVTISVNLSHQHGADAAPVSSATLEVSSDDGATWRPVTLQPDGAGRYLGVIAPSGQFMSLRLHAVDGSGATLDQQVIRAFAVAGR